MMLELEGVGWVVGVSVVDSFELYSMYVLFVEKGARFS